MKKLELYSVEQWTASFQTWANRLPQDKFVQVMGDVNVVTDALRAVYQPATIATRLDNLTALYRASDTFIQNNPDRKPAELADIKIMHEQAGNMMRAILDVGVKEMDTHLQYRANAKASNPNYIPNWLPRMASEEIEKSEAAAGLKDLDDVAREKYRVMISGGEFCELSVNGKGDAQTLSIKNFDTTPFSASGGPKRAKFVISKEGDMFCDNTLEVGPVFFAGDIKVSRSGEVEGISNEAEYYDPVSNNFGRALQYLSERSVNLEEVAVEEMNSQSGKREKIEYEKVDQVTEYKQANAVKATQQLMNRSSIALNRFTAGKGGVFSSKSYNEGAVNLLNAMSELQRADQMDLTSMLEPMVAEYENLSAQKPDNYSKAVTTVLCNTLGVNKKAVSDYVKLGKEAKSHANDPILTAFNELSAEPSLVAGKGVSSGV